VVITFCKKRLSEAACFGTHACRQSQWLNESRMRQCSSQHSLMCMPARWAAGTHPHNISCSVPVAPATNMKRTQRVLSNTLLSHRLSNTLLSSRKGETGVQLGKYKRSTHLCMSHKLDHDNHKCIPQPLPSRCSGSKAEQITRNWDKQIMLYGRNCLSRVQRRLAPLCPPGNKHLSARDGV